MTRDEIIEGLEKEIRRIHREPKEKMLGIFMTVDEAEDIVDMLKEQEAVKPLREHSGGGTTWWNICGNCRTAINPNDKFCHECGRKVRWND